MVRSLTVPAQLFSLLFQVTFQNDFLDEGVSVYWLGDFVFVESGLGVRVKFDRNNTVYVTVTAEHQSATRGLCGVYNSDADGEELHRHSLFLVICLAAAHVPAPVLIPSS